VAAAKHGYSQCNVFVLVEVSYSYVNDSLCAVSAD